VNPKALSTYIGQTLGDDTYDSLGHRDAGSKTEAAAAALLDAYLDRQAVPQTVPQVAQRQALRA